jgi:tRNA(Ile)-lysidine synthase TilS/MesJ
MQKMLSRIRRCIEDYGMISDGDRVAVGVSGGKDSLTALVTLSELLKFYPKRFEVAAITVDMGYEEMDFKPVTKLCESLGICHIIIPTDIRQVVFEVRHEENPCSLCANMRRGALYNAAAAHGYNKVALGHHTDDAVETFILSLVYEGRINCFRPVTYLSRSGITAIRPLIYCREKYINAFAREYELPLVNNPCTANGETKREYAAGVIASMKAERGDIMEKIVGAMQRLPLEGWQPLSGTSQHNKEDIDAGNI